jgi:hypothetical protein
MQSIIKLIIAPSIYAVLSIIHAIVGTPYNFQNVALTIILSIVVFLAIDKIFGN